MPYLEPRRLAGDLQRRRAIRSFAFSEMGSIDEKSAEEPRSEGKRSGACRIRLYI